MASRELTDIDDEKALDELLSASRQRPQWIFKHSATCPISSAALAAFRAYLTDAPEHVDHWRVTVQAARPLSDAIEERLKLRHESPQAILVRDGRVAWHASHWSITSSAVSDAVAG